MTPLEKKIEKHKQKCSRNKTHGEGGYLGCFTFQDLMRRWHAQNKTPTPEQERVAREAKEETRHDEARRRAKGERDESLFLPEDE